jgi:hypothetical protein
MAGTGFRKDRGWTIYANAVDPRAFGAALRRNMRRATMLNGKLAVAAVRNAIRSGDFVGNAPLTIMIKGSDKPLVDQGSGLFQAVADEVVDDNTVFVGIKRTDGHYNIALALHDGVSIRVTMKMRGMFFALWQASVGQMDPGKLTGRAAELWARHPGDWRPLLASTEVITIPPRPYLDKAFQSTALRAAVRNNWQQAVQATLRELASGGR